MSAFSPAPAETYVGSAACGKCHPDEFRLQSATNHARALYRATQHPLANLFLPRVPLSREPNYEFRFALERRGWLVRVASPDRAIVLPIEWAFGAGAQAVTFVGRLDSANYLEHYFSFYTKNREMGITPGQDAVPARDLLDAAGTKHPILDIVGCFYCHSTGQALVADGEVQPNEVGVRCETCHGPGGEHQQTKGKAPIRNPRRLSAVEVNDVCGRCHRPALGAGAKFDWNNPWNTRFEPTYLSQSACFLKSSGKLSCLSCHAAHAELQHDNRYYNKVCTSCHASIHRAAQMDNCIACHMPRVAPRPPLSFANHWIGIDQAGRLKDNKTR